jgi:hypothetical protein
MSFNIKVKIDEIKLLLKPAGVALQTNPAQADVVLQKLDGLTKEMKALKDHIVKREDKILDRLLKKLEAPYEG